MHIFLKWVSVLRTPLIVKDKRMTCYTPWLPSRKLFFFFNAAHQQTGPAMLPGMKWIQVYQLLEISFIWRQNNKSFQYEAGCVLVFISTLSLRMEGGRERRRGTEGGRSALCRWQDWLCVWWMGLSQTVTGLCSIHVDIQYALHRLTSREPFCPDDLQIVSSLAAYGEHSRWGVSHTDCWSAGSKNAKTPGLFWFRFI